MVIRSYTVASHSRHSDYSWMDLRGEESNLPFYIVLKVIQKQS